MKYLKGYSPHRDAVYQVEVSDEVAKNLGRYGYEMSDEPFPDVPFPDSVLRGILGTGRAAAAG